MTKELYVSVIEERLKEMERMAGETLSWYEINTKHINNLAKEFYKKHCKRIDWPAYSLDLNLIENIWSLMKSRLNQISTSKISEVILKVKEIWEELNQEYFDN